MRRRVALKVIKPGMDTKAVVARFEAERQALAMLDHPNIAQVLELSSRTGAGMEEWCTLLVAEREKLIGAGESGRCIS